MGKKALLVVSFGTSFEEALSNRQHRRNLQKGISGL